MLSPSPVQQDSKPLSLGVFGGWRRSLRARRGQQHPVAARKNSDSAVTPVKSNGEIRLLLGERAKTPTNELRTPEDGGWNEEDTGSNPSPVPRGRLLSSGLGRRHSFRNAMDSPMVS